MPIASGANSWPNQFYNKVDVKEPPKKIPPPPKSFYRQQTVITEDPPNYVTSPKSRDPIETVISPPPPRREYPPVRRSPVPRREFIHETPTPPPPPPPQAPRRKMGPCNGECVGAPCCIGGFCYPRDKGLPHEGCCKYGCTAGCGGCCCTRGYWEPVDIFNETMPYQTGGCCGSPYEYNKGTKKQICRRCCTVFLGMLFPLLLIGGIVAAVIVLQGQAAEARDAAAEELYPDGYFQDGVFYVPIAEGDTYYAVKGQPAIDMCWQLWSTLMDVTPSSPPRVFRTETSTVPTPLPSTTPTLPPTTTQNTATTEEFTGTVTMQTETTVTMETTETEEPETTTQTTTPTLPPTSRTTTPVPSRIPRFTTVTVSLPDCYRLTTRIDYVRQEDSQDPALLFIRNYSNAGVKNNGYLAVLLVLPLIVLYLWS